MESVFLSLYSAVAQVHRFQAPGTERTQQGARPNPTELHAFHSIATCVQFQRNLANFQGNLLSRLVPDDIDKLSFTRVIVYSTLMYFLSFTRVIVYSTLMYFLRC